MNHKCIIDEFKKLIGWDTLNFEIYKINYNLKYNGELITFADQYGINEIKYINNTYFCGFGFNLSISINTNYKYIRKNFNDDGIIYETRKYIDLNKYITIKKYRNIFENKYISNNKNTKIYINNYLDYTLYEIKINCLRSGLGIIVNNLKILRFVKKSNIKLLKSYKMHSYYNGLILREFKINNYKILIYFI